MQNLKDKVVIITGASSGIGEATAYKLAKAGAKLVLGARREDRLKANSRSRWASCLSYDRRGEARR